MTTTTAQQQLDAYLNGELEMWEVLKMSPAYFSRLKARAQYFCDQRYYDRALIMLEMIAALERRDPTAELLSAQILAEMGRKPCAIDKLTRVRQKFPQCLEAMLVLAELNFRQGDWVATQALLEDILQIDPLEKSVVSQQAAKLLTLVSGCGETR